jgi:hypothetical protein
VALEVFFLFLSFRWGVVFFFVGLVLAKEGVTNKTETYIPTKEKEDESMFGYEYAGECALFGELGDGLCIVCLCGFVCGVWVTARSAAMSD